MSLSRTLLVSLIVLLGSCGSEDSSDSGLGSSTHVIPSPRVTSTRFLEAIRTDDTGVFRALLTENAREALSKEEGFSFDGESVDSFEIGEETITGETAEVAVTIHRDGDAQEADLLLRKELDLWRIHGMSVAFGDGKFTLDFEAVSEITDAIGEFGEELGREMTEHFEEAFSDMQTIYEQGGTLEQIAANRARFEALQPISEESFTASWQVDVEGDGRTAGTLIADLLESTGLEMISGEHEVALRTATSISLSEVSRVHATEEIAASAGLYPVWPDLTATGYGAGDGQPEKLTFATGVRPYPTALAGPFLIEVSELDEEAPRPIGELTIVVRALGLDAGALAYQTEMGEVLRIDKLRSATDEPLAVENLQQWSTPEVQGSYFTFSMGRELTGLLRAVEEISLVEGEVRFALPTDVEEFELAGSEKERELSVGTVTVNEWSKDVRFDVQGTKESLEGVELRMSPRKASGDPLGTLFGSANGWGANLQANVQCPEPPAALDVKLCTERVLSFPFELRSIPLQRFAEQPERLEALSFGGKAPVQAALIGAIRRDGDQAEVTLKLTNSSNKDATSVMIEFFYVDGQGSELSDFPHTLNGEYDFDAKATGPLVTAGQTKETTSFAAFLPKEAVSVRFKVKRVEFPDGTEWALEE